MSNKLTNEQRKLITDNYKLLHKFVDHVISKRIIPKCMEDEFISDMYLRFCFSALRYNADTGFKFSTYAHYGFEFGIRDIITVKKKRFDRIQYVDIINEDNLRDFQLDKKKISLRSDIMDNFVSNVELTSKERSMLEDYYYNEMSFSRLGEKYKLSKEGSRLVVNRAVNKLKKEAVEMGLDIEDFYT